MENQLPDSNIEPKSEPYNPEDLTWFAKYRNGKLVSFWEAQDSTPLIKKDDMMEGWEE